MMIPVGGKNWRVVVVFEIANYILLHTKKPTIYIEVCKYF